jgi:hypothetical protein
VDIHPSIGCLRLSVAGPVNSITVRKCIKASAYSKWRILLVLSPRMHLRFTSHKVLCSGLFVDLTRFSSLSSESGSKLRYTYKDGFRTGNHFSFGMVFSRSSICVRSSIPVSDASPSGPDWSVFSRTRTQDFDMWVKFPAFAEWNWAWLRRAFCENRPNFESFFWRENDFFQNPLTIEIWMRGGTRLFRIQRVTLHIFRVHPER